MLHRFTLIFSLIVSFGMAQIGALTHEISHHTNLAAQNQQQDLNKNSSKNSQNDQTQHNQVCEKCISYAELGNLIQSADLAISTFVGTNPRIYPDLQTSSHAKPRTYTARAPPTLA
ncbi:MAG: hypothetical protein ACXW11_10725 [Methylotenera sp.]